MVPRPTPPAAADEERRPGALLFVYSWDIVRAILALFGAIAVFSGNVVVNGRTVGLSAGAQILTALSYAAFGTAFILIGTLLTRHAAWVRRAQLVILSMAIVVALTSFAIVQLRAGTGLDVGPLLGVLLVSLVDLLAIVVMTSPRVTAWYREPGQVPLYVGGLIAFWGATSAGFVVLRGLQ